MYTFMSVLFQNHRDLCSSLPDKDYEASGLDDSIPVFHAGTLHQFVRPTLPWQVDSLRCRHCDAIRLHSTLQYLKGIWAGAC